MHDPTMQDWIGESGCDKRKWKKPEIDSKKECVVVLMQTWYASASNFPLSPVLFILSCFFVPESLSFTSLPLLPALFTSALPQYLVVSHHTTEL